jgi:hypothetical protein
MCYKLERVRIYNDAKYYAASIHHRGSCDSADISSLDLLRLALRKLILLKFYRGKQSALKTLKD